MSNADQFDAVNSTFANVVIAMATGRYDRARTEGHRLVEVFPQATEIGLIFFAARAALLARDPDGAAEDLAQVDPETHRGRALDADRTTIRAGIAALEGRTDEALALYRDALATWRDLGLLWDEALCAIDMATLLDPSEPEVLAAAQAARPILTKLRAQPFLDRLEAALVRTSSAPSGRADLPTLAAASTSGPVEAEP